MLCCLWILFLIFLLTYGGFCLGKMEPRVALFLGDKALPKLSLNSLKVCALVRLEGLHILQGALLGKGWAPLCSWKAPFRLMCLQFHMAPGTGESSRALESERCGFIPALNTTSFVIWGSIRSETFSSFIKREETAYYTELLCYLEIMF